MIRLHVRLTSHPDAQITLSLPLTLLCPERFSLLLTLFPPSHAFLPAPQKVEDWLYDEGEDCTKSVYIAKLEELKKFGGPVEERLAEEQV